MANLVQRTVSFDELCFITKGYNEFKYNEPS